jgi:hypothetical protein
MGIVKTIQVASVPDASRIAGNVTPQAFDCHPGAGRPRRPRCSTGPRNHEPANRRASIFASLQVWPQRTREQGSLPQEQVATTLWEAVPANLAAQLGPGITSRLIAVYLFLPAYRSGPKDSRTGFAPTGAGCHDLVGDRPRRPRCSTGPRNHESADRRASIFASLQVRPPKDSRTGFAPTGAGCHELVGGRPRRPRCSTRPRNREPADRRVSILPACRSGPKGLANRVRSHRSRLPRPCGSEPCSRVL